MPNVSDPQTPSEPTPAPTSQSASNKTIALYAVIALLVGVIGGLLFSNNGHDGMMRMNHDRNSSHTDMMSADPNPNPTDVSDPEAMFFQMMIPHHQQAIDMSNFALTNSQNADVVALANKIITAQTGEITQMKQWLTDAGESLESPEHMGHGMGGMLSDSDMAELAKATGTQFDRLWLQGMIAHHEGALHMVHMIDNSPNAETDKFGENVTKAQSAEITQMKAMLAKLG